jgi:hypothetical protein
MFIALVIALWTTKPPLEQIIFAHAPEWLVSTARPETELIGISVDHDSLADVKRRYGSPSGVSRAPNQATYHWNKGDLELVVDTVYPDGVTQPAGEHVISVSVRGNRSIPAAKTRAGVHLGDKLSKLIATYGNRYQMGHRKDIGDGIAVVFIFSDDTELAAELNHDGVIVSLRLTASEE